MPTRDVIFNIIGRDGASPAFAKAGAAAEGAAAKVQAASARMVAVGSRLTHTLTLPLLAIGAAAVKSATDFNASMTRIQTQAGASAKDVQYLTKQVLDMQNVQYGPNELAKALYHLKSVGLENVQAMKALRVSQDLAAVGGANLEDTTNALAGAWRTGIKGAKDFHQAAATINAIIGAGNMTLADFNAALSTGILPSAKTFGLTLKDVGSALALFTDEGVNSASAATRLRMSFSLLAAPSMAADKVLRGIGLTGHQLGEEMRKPNGLIQTIGLLKTHLEGLNNYYPNPTAADNFVNANYARFQSLAGQKMKDLTASQRAFINQYGMAKDNHEVLAKSQLDPAEQAALLSRAFGGGRSSSAILSLINNYDVLLKKQNQVTDSLSKYNHAVKVQQATPEAQFKERIAEFEKAGVILGTDLLPAATGAANEIAHLAQGFNNLSPAARGTVEEIAKWAIIIGPTLLIGGKLISMFTKVGLAAKSAALFMAAPYRATEEQAAIAALRTEAANAQIQADEALTAAAVARSEAEKATAAEDAALRIAVAAEDTDAALRGVATQAALNAIDFNAAMQSEAAAAQKMALSTAAAAEVANEKLSVAMAGATRNAFALQSAMGGLGVGLTVGMFTRGASTSTKLLSSLGSAAVGAAIGLSMGGPLGAAIGGLAGGLSSLAVQFLHVGSTADQSSQLAQQGLENQNQAASDLLSTLKDVNGAYVKQTRVTVANLLQSTPISKGGPDLLSAAGRLGIKPADLAGAVLGNDRLLDKVHKQIFKFAGGPMDAFATQVAVAFDSVTIGAGDAEKAFERYNAALGKSLVTPKLLAQGTEGLAKALHGTGNALNDVSALGIRNTAIVRMFTGAIDNSTQKALEHHQAIGKVSQAYESQIGSLFATLRALHFNDQAVRDLITTYGHVPARVVTYLEKHGVTEPDIQAIVDALYRVPKHLTTDIEVVYHQLLTGSGPPQAGGNGVSAPGLIGGGPRHARGGYITGPGSAISDSIPSWLSNGEYVVNAAATAQHRAMLDAMNYGSRGYARGGAVDGRPVAASRERRLKVAGGTLRLDLGGGRTLDAYVQEIVLAELDYAADH